MSISGKHIAQTLLLSGALITPSFVSASNQTVLDKQNALPEVYNFLGEVSDAVREKLNLEKSPQIHTLTLTRDIPEHVIKNPLCATTRPSSVQFSSPIEHTVAEQRRIRRSILEILRGKCALPEAIDNIAKAVGAMMIIATKGASEGLNIKKASFLDFTPDQSGVKKKYGTVENLLLNILTSSADSSNDKLKFVLDPSTGEMIIFNDANNTQAHRDVARSKMPRSPFNSLFFGYISPKIDGRGYDISDYHSVYDFQKMDPAVRKRMQYITNFLNQFLQENKDKRIAPK